MGLHDFLSRTDITKFPSQPRPPPPPLPSQAPPFLPTKSTTQQISNFPIVPKPAKVPRPAPQFPSHQPLLASSLSQIFTHVIRSDYDAFCALGPGGTPSTFPGYLRIKFLGLFALNNPYKPPPIPSSINRSPYLQKQNLVRRQGTRPQVRGIAPHRQLDQKSESALFEVLRARIEALGVEHEGLRYGTSCLEKHGPGLFAVNPVNRTRHCAGEVGHAHPFDGSMHLTLHPADAALVLSQAWGELHPLSSGGWLERFVPPGFVMVYAPRNEEEVEILMEIVKAAVWWVGDVDVNGIGAREGRLQTFEGGKEVGSATQLPELVRGVM